MAQNRAHFTNTKMRRVANRLTKRGKEWPRCLRTTDFGTVPAGTSSSYAMSDNGLVGCRLNLTEIQGQVEWLVLLTSLLLCMQNTPHHCSLFGEVGTSLRSSGNHSAHAIQSSVSLHLCLHSSLVGWVFFAVYGCADSTITESKATKPSILGRSTKVQV